MISMRSMAGITCPARTGALGEENRAEATGIISGNSLVSENFFFSTSSR